MSFRYRYRKQILISIVIVSLIFLSSFLIIYSFNTKDNKRKKEDVVVLKNSNDNDIKKTSKNKSDNKTNDSNSNYLMVDVKGQVNSPGTYKLDDSKRVIDAINMAGGTTEYADISVLNLSKKLKDEMVIIVYSYDEVNNFRYIKQVEQQVNNECANGVNDVNNDACCDDTDNSNSSIVSINNASKEELMQLEGIGEAKANAIIKYRDENGGFKDINDLLKVSGIGEELFAKIKENITL